MNARLGTADTVWYQHNIQQYVDNIDQFVLALQHYSERKMWLVLGISLIGAMGIFLLVFLRYGAFASRSLTPLRN